jgi:hypothetical protein
MKYFLSFLISITYFFSSAQQPKINNIREVKSLNIYGSNNRTTIGQLIINQQLESKLLLWRTSQVLDSSGRYRTEFLFKNPEGVPTFGVKLDFSFNKPCDTAYSNFDGVLMQYYWGYVGSKSKFRIAVGQVNPNSAVRLIVFSKEPIYTTIEGLKGIAKF